MAKRSTTPPKKPHQGPRILFVGEFGPPRPGQWHDARFIPNPRKTRTECLSCGKSMWFPASKVGLYQRCGEACGHRARAIHRKKVRPERPCETCGKMFSPRTTQIRAGIGKYCSRKCNAALAAARANPDLIPKRTATRKASREAGKWAPRSGPDHPKWKGGDEVRRQARAQKNKEDGSQAAYTRAWRKANPDRVKEQTHRRRGRKLAALPYGTIPKIRKAQKDRCAICKTKLKGKGHVDHVTPLLRGGEHAPRNLQLLCATCNVRKSAKDPLDYMRERGKLL